MTVGLAAREGLGRWIVGRITVMHGLGSVARPKGVARLDQPRCLEQVRIEVAKATSAPV